MKTVVMNEQLYEYVLRMSVPEDPLLLELLEETEKLEIPMIQVSPDQGRLLNFLCRMCGAERALEIGTLTGYSGIHIARALPDSGLLVTIDINPLHTQTAQKYFARAGLAEKVKPVVSHALRYLKELAEDGERFDFVFIDADKTGYRDYFEQCLRITGKGSLILFDNMLKGGSVIDSSVSDPDLDAIREMNLMLKEDSRVEYLMLTVGDGLGLCIVK